MAYVVLARKYRPQRFADLVGQEHVTRTLANAIAHNRVHHAYLFCGGRGLGKTTAARLLAKCLVCVNGPTIEACNVCHECVAVTEGRSVDVIEIDGASNNKVEDVRNIREQVRYLPQTARRKIYIIDEVHMLTGSAFNALLKTLEEPPEHVTFIFATTEVHELPATILSRVSRFDFRRLSSAQLVGHLQRILASEGVSVEEAGLYTVARAGDGSVRDSLTLLDKVIAFASDTNKIGADEVRVVLGVPGALAVAGLVEAVLARDPTLTLRRFDEVFASGQDLLALALEFLKYLRDLMIVKLCGTREVLVDASDAEFEALTQQASGVDSVVLAQLFDRFTRVVDALPRTRVPRLVLEMGLLDLVHSEPLVPLGDLIDRLEQISSGAPGTGGGGSRPVPAPARSSPPVGTPARTRADAPATPAPATPAPATPAVPAPARGGAIDDTSPYAKILGSLLGGGTGEAASRAAERPAEATPGGSRGQASSANVHAGRPTQAEATPGSGRAQASPANMQPERPAEVPPGAGRSAAGVHAERPAQAEARPVERPVHAAPPAGNRPSESRPTGSPGPAERVGRSAPAAPPEDEPPPWPDDPNWGSEGPMEARNDAPEAAWRPTPAESRGSSPHEAPRRPAAAEPAARAEYAAPQRAQADARRPAPDAPRATVTEAPADCGTGCPGAPQPERSGTIAWASMPMLAAWEAFLDRLRSHEGPLFAILADLGLAKLGDGVLRLAGTPQHFARNHLRDHAPLRAHLESLLQQHLGLPFRLELVEGEPNLQDLPSLGLIEARRAAELQKQVEQEAHTDPRILALKAQFNAQVRSVRPRGAPQSRGL